MSNKYQKLVPRDRRWLAGWLQVVLAGQARLPAGPLSAQQWLAMLAHGALDATVAPQQAASVIDLLWAATQHAVPQVLPGPAAACTPHSLAEQAANAGSSDIHSAACHAV